MSIPSVSTIYTPPLVAPISRPSLPLRPVDIPYTAPLARDLPTEYHVTTPVVTAVNPVVTQPSPVQPPPLRVAVPPQTTEHVTTTAATTQAFLGLSSIPVPTTTVARPIPVYTSTTHTPSINLPSSVASPPLLANAGLSSRVLTEIPLHLTLPTGLTGIPLEIRHFRYYDPFRLVFLDRYLYIYFDLRYKLAVAILEPQ